MRICTIAARQPISTEQQLYCMDFPPQTGGKKGLSWGLLCRNLRSDQH